MLTGEDQMANPPPPPPPPVPGVSSGRVEELVRREVPDWDDDVVSAARFKAFSGQRSDWEPKLLFWKDLIITVARHLGIFIVSASEVKNTWFSRGGLTPLCIDHVLLDMYANDEILLKGDLVDPTRSYLHQVIRRMGQLMFTARSLDLRGNIEGHLILKTLLQERCADVIKTLAESHWTTTCIMTMGKFQSICKGSDEASAVLSYLCQCGKGRYFSIKKDFIEGVKVSLVSASVSNISSLDCDTLHLIWSTEKLQQQLDIIDRRWESSRKMALLCFKSGNKKAAYRHIRQAKLFSDSIVRCTSLLERVEEVIGVIANAESTKKVSEAIQVGVRAVKENKISAEDVYLQLEELEEIVSSQKQVDDAMGSEPLQYTDVEDEDLEEELKKLEVELADETSPFQRAGSPNEAAADDVPEGVRTQEPAESLIQTMSNLNLEAA